MVGINRREFVRIMGIAGAGTMLPDIAPASGAAHAAAQMHLPPFHPHHKPYDLRCEYLANPVGIDVPHPHFSWKLPDASDVRGQKQTVYRLLVASNAALLNSRHGDLWDTGKIASPQSTLVPYAGRSLSSNQQCFWKVQVFGNAGQSLGWSPVATFSMGLLHPADWTGDWIHHPTAAPHQHLWFRKDFTLPSRPAPAFMHVASVGYHELYINGRKADDRVLAPSLTRLDKRVFYVTYDITSLLRKGPNTIGIWTGPGWSRFATLHTHPALRVQFSPGPSAGGAAAVVTDTTWRTTISSSQNTGKNTYMNNGGEEIDARKYIPRWNKNGYDASHWPHAAATQIKAELSAQPMEPSRLIQTIRARKISRINNAGHAAYTVDMGTNFTGWLAIRFNGLSAGDAVTIQVADHTSIVQSFAQWNKYIASGKAGEMFRNRFNYSGGRYVTITGFKRRPRLADITGYAVSNDFQRTGFFTCSNSLFNRIYETDLWTYRCNTVEGYTSDCPHRERLGYGEETFANAWGIGLPNYETGAFYKNLVRDWTDVQEPNGWIHYTAPQVNGCYGGPMWSSGGLNVSWEHYQTYGDKRVLEQIYPSARRWLAFLEAHVSGGLLRPYSHQWGKFLGDWAAPGGRKERGGTPEALFFNNCVFALNLQRVIDIARVLEKPEDVRACTQRLEALRPHIQQQFFNRDQRNYASGTQVQMAFALLTGVTPQHLRPAVLASFRNNILHTHPYFDMGSSGLPVLLKYLVEDSGHAELAFPPLVKVSQPSYGYFLARGETTWPEYWSDDCASHIHTCYTAISSWLIKSVAGIRPDPAHPGYGNCLVQPVLAGNLRHAAASVESPYGRITSRWEKRGRVVTLAVQIPPNSTATIYVPTSSASAVTESGKPANRAAGVTAHGTHGKYAVFHVGSGRYRFSSRA